MTTDELLKENERVDDLQRNGYKIIQDPGRFCFGMDAVLLSGFARAREGARVIDLGTGTGIIPILMEAKTKAAHLTGLEIQEESADMARRSVQLNGLTDKITIVTGDLKEALDALLAREGHAEYARACFDFLPSLAKQISPHFQPSISTS